MLILPNKRVTQPQQYVQIGGGIARELSFLWTPSAGNVNREWLSGENGTKPTGGEFISTAIGNLGKYAAGGSTKAARWDGTRFKASTDYTVFALVVDNSGRGSVRNPFDGDDSDATRVFQLRFTAANKPEFITFNTSGAATTAIGADISSATGASIIVGRISSNAISVFLNGMLSGTATATGTPRTIQAANTKLSIGAGARTGTYQQGFSGQIYLCGHFARSLSDAEIRALSDNPWQIFTPDYRESYIYVQNAAGGPVTHATTGALTGQGSSIVGSAVHIATHTTTGALTGQGAAVDGSASRTRDHATDGVLTGQGSTVDGTAAHIAIHTSSGVLTGQGAVIDGTADHVAAGGTHTTSGALTGQGSVVDGSAARIPNHQTSGTLTGPGSELAGTAVHNVPHGTSGELTGQGSAIDGSAVHILNHQTSGELSGQGAIIDGSAARVAAAVTHDTSGELIGIGSELSGAAQNGIIVADTTQNSGGFVDFGTLSERRRLKNQEESKKPKPVQQKPEPQKPVVENKPKLTPVISDLLEKSANDYVKSNVVPIKSSNDAVKKSLAKQRRIEKEKQLLKEREEIERQLKEQEEKELAAVKLLIEEYQVELQEQEDELILQFMLEL